MKKSFFLGLCALGASAFIARGNINLVDPTVSAAPGGFTWDYAANVTATETVVTGSTFTIYDFGSFTAPITPAGWTFSSSLTTTPPGGLTITDDPTSANLTWTYSGPAINGAQALGDFGAISAFNLAHDGEYAALATSTSQGSPDVNGNNIPVPVPEASTLLPILSVCGASIAAGIPSLLRRRKKS
jgi:hypothetical protein